MRNEKEPPYRCGKHTTLPIHIENGTNVRKLSFFLVLFLNSFVHSFICSFVHSLIRSISSYFFADRQLFDSCEHLFSYDRLQIVCCYFVYFLVRSFCLFLFGLNDSASDIWNDFWRLFCMNSQFFGSRIACVSSALGRKSYSKVIWQIRSDY